MFAWCLKFGNLPIYHFSLWGNNTSNGYKKYKSSLVGFWSPYMFLNFKSFSGLSFFQAGKLSWRVTTIECSESWGPLAFIALVGFCAASAPLRSVAFGTRLPTKDLTERNSPQRMSRAFCRQIVSVFVLVWPHVLLSCCCCFSSFPIFSSLVAFAFRFSLVSVCACPCNSHVAFLSPTP